MPDEILDYWLAQARELASRFNLDEFDSSSDMWNWENLGEEISTLRNRLGIGDRYVDILGLRVDLQTGETYDQIKNEAANTSRMIPHLYYYSKAKDKGLANEWVRFGSLKGSWGCRFSYDEKTVSALETVFDESEKQIVEALEIIGAERAAYRDVSFEIAFLPRVRVLLILERGDEDLPSSARLLYDRNSIFYLPHEMLGHISWFLTGRVFTAISCLKH